MPGVSSEATLTAAEDLPSGAWQQVLHPGPLPSAVLS